MTAPQTSGVYRRPKGVTVGTVTQGKAEPPAVTPTSLPCAACLTVATATAVLRRDGARRALDVIVRAAA